MECLYYGHNMAANGDYNISPSMLFDRNSQSSRIDSEHKGEDVDLPKERDEGRSEGKSLLLQTL
jgi:hypothetical protein